MTAKDTVRQLLDRLPDDSNLDAILYHLYVLRETEAGHADIAAGRVISHEEVGQELRQRWLLGRTG